MKTGLSIRDIQSELGCSQNHARKLVLTEMPHINIGLGDNPIWRVSRRDFDKWTEARKTDPMIQLEEFKQKFM